MPVKKIPASPRLRGASKIAVSKTSKFSVPVVDLAGKKKGSVELPKELFGAKVNEKLMAQDHFQFL